MAEPGDTSLSADTDSEYGAVLSRLSAPFTGDLDEMRQRRVIRVLASHSQSNFFCDGGHPRGFEVELWREFEEFLNEGSGLEREVRIVFIPTPFGRLLTDLRTGRGDVAAAGLTITTERRAQVAFSDPYLSDIDEVVVGNRSLSGLEAMEDLSGRTVFVTAGSSYAEHLHDLSRKLAETGLPAVEVVEAVPELVTENLLEMVHAGILDLTVVDDHIARAWAEVMPELHVREDLVVHRGGSIGWAVRRENPELRAILNAFVRQNRKGTLLGNILFKRYFGQSRWIGNPISEAERSKLAEGAGLFQKYAARYDLD